MNTDDLQGVFPGPVTVCYRPKYIYVASSWRNPIHIAVCSTLRSVGLQHYDFRNPEGGTGFSWKDVKPGGYPGMSGGSATTAGDQSDWESTEDYLEMIRHPRALEGYASDYQAMEKADTFLLVLPCGKSAHLELGWAVGAGKRTAILLEDPVQPELMYRMVDYISPSLFDLLGWLGCED